MAINMSMAMIIGMIALPAVIVFIWVFKKKLTLDVVIISVFSMIFKIASLLSLKTISEFVFGMFVMIMFIPFFIIITIATSSSMSAFIRTPWFGFPAMVMRCRHMFSYCHVIHHSEGAVTSKPQMVINL